MCVNVPNRIVGLLGDKKALVQNRLGVERVVSLELLGCATLDDYVIVRGGFALQKLDPQEAKDIISLANALAVMIQLDPAELAPTC